MIFIQVLYLGMMDEDLSCCKFAGSESLVQICGVFQLFKNSLNSHSMEDSQIIRRHISAVNTT